MPEPIDPQSFVPSFPPLASFGGAPLYVTGEDAIAVTVMNAAPGAIVTITGRMLEFGQTRPSPFTQALTPATDRSESVLRFSLGDGWLLNAQVKVSGGTPASGQTWARLSLVRGLTINANDLFTLAAGYVTAKMPISYPGSAIGSSLDGGGALRSIAGATPAAGAEISETVPTGARWEVLAFAFTLATAAAVANRAVLVTIDDGAAVYLRSSFNVNQTASLTWNYELMQGFGNPVISQILSLHAPIPTNNRLGSGHRVKTVTGAIQAADQYSAVQYLVREWIEGA